MPFWNNKKVLVTGGAGFVGSHTVEKLLTLGAKVRVIDNLENENPEDLKQVKDEIEFIKGDLRVMGDCLKAVKDIEIVINVAAKVGGIEFNRFYPGTMFRDNVLMNTNMLEAARIKQVERFLVVSSACVYPRHCKIPTPETEGFVGVPEPTNDGYGWAKRMAEVQADVYSREFNMNIGIVRPYNTYGPRDHFNTGKGHVIAALIKRIYDGENPLLVWGDGEQSRAFLYVSDFVRGLIMAIEKYPVPDPINLGTSEEVKIKDLVKLIVKCTGVKVDIIFDSSKLSGQPRRNCDVTKVKNIIGFEAEVNLEEGLKKTIEWYINHKNKRKRK